MIDHLDAMNRLAEARARQALSEGRRRPIPFHLSPAIMDAPEVRTRPSTPAEPASRTTWHSRLSWLRPMIPKPT